MTHLANVVSGAAFRSAALSIGAIVLILSLTGYALYVVVGASMLRELEAQVSEETILFQLIHARNGQEALVEAITQLENPALAGPRIAALFDSHGNSLAGNLSLAPDFIGWRSLTLDVLGSSETHRAHVQALRLASGTLVVGRTTRLLDATLARFLLYLALAGVAIVLATLIIGYLASRRVYLKLATMASSLDDVSRGEMQTRIPVGAGNDQLDRVARTINSHLDQLEILMGSTRNTVNAIAHDLRTPLNRTYLRLQEALSRDAIDGPTADLIEDAGTELTALTYTFDTILRIASIEAGGDKQGFERFSLDTLVADMADVFAPIAEAAGQVLVCDTGRGADLAVHGDRQMLRQMLVNLLENAIRHCPADTTIRLATSGTTQDGPRLSVTDTGPGVEAAFRDRVLEPFFRLDASRTSEGSGLGLTLVKAIAARHNASVCLEDNAPGLRVTIAFPSVA